jgi:hypothetical protein
MKHWIIASLVVCGLPACSSGGNVDLGDDNPVSLGAELEDYTGHWQGYAEAHEFTPGSDRMLLNIDKSGEGYALFGEGTAPPPATNPDVAYPEGLSLMELVTQKNRFLGGVRYPLHDVIVEDRRIRFSVSWNDLYQDWCRLQEPVLRLETGSGEPQYGFYAYSSMVQTGEQCFNIDRAGAMRIPVDCGRFQLDIERVCQCNAASCASNADEGRVSFDAALQSRKELVGTLTVAGRVTVRLSRE